MAGRVATAGPASLLAAAVIFVDGCPRPALGLLLWNPTLLVALGYVVGLALLLVGIFRLVAAGHDDSPVQFILNEKVATEFPQHAPSAVAAKMDADAYQKIRLGYGQCSQILLSF